MKRREFLKCMVGVGALAVSPTLAFAGKSQTKHFKKVIDLQKEFVNENYHMIAFTRSGSQAKLYIDGILKKEYYMHENAKRFSISFVQGKKEILKFANKNLEDSFSFSFWVTPNQQEVTQVGDFAVFSKDLPKSRILDHYIAGK